VTVDDALKVLRSMRTSRLARCRYDRSSRRITAELHGETRVPVQVTVYDEDTAGGITERRVDVPVFTGKQVVEIPG